MKDLREGVKRLTRRHHKVQAKADRGVYYGPCHGTTCALAEHLPEPNRRRSPVTVEALTYKQLLALVDRLTAENKELKREKQRALHELHLMRGNGILDLPKLEHAIKGEPR